MSAETTAEQHFCLICHNPIDGPAADCPHCRSRAIDEDPASPPLLVIAGVVAAMVGLWIAAELATAYFRETRAARQQAHMLAAAELSETGDPEAALKEYRAALEFGRFDFEARLGLARTLEQVGRFSEARNHLIDLRRADPTHAVVNLLLGRIAAAENDLGAAVGYYRTAIHGRWPTSSEQQRFQARLDLAGLLVSSGDQLQAVAELTDALEEAPARPTVRKRIARLWLEAGAPARAAEVFENVVRDAPEDAAALMGLGEAEFARGRYLSARTAFNRAAAARAPATQVQPWLELCTEIIDLDPTYRRVGTRERLRRGQELAARSLAELERCVQDDLTPSEGAPRTPAVVVVESAREQLARRVPAGQAEEFAEQYIGLAENLWNVREALCPSQAPDDALRHVLEKLAQ